VKICLILGALLGHQSSAQTFSPLIGAELYFDKAVTIVLPLEESFEYGFLVDSGSVEFNGREISEGSLHYIPEGSTEVSISASSKSRIMMLGGEPFEEEIVMWWNFIGRSHEDIVEMREAWESHSNRFAPFVDHLGERIPAPGMPNIRLTSRSNSSRNHS
jgi:redox-sensitive bicupin YhaK (pirin superfamily)